MIKWLMCQHNLLRMSFRLHFIIGGCWPKLPVLTRVERRQVTRNWTTCYRCKWNKVIPQIRNSLETRNMSQTALHLMKHCYSVAPLSRSTVPLSSSQLIFFTLSHPSWSIHHCLHQTLHLIPPPVASFSLRDHWHPPSARLLPAKNQEETR